MHTFPSLHVMSLFRLDVLVLMKETRSIYHLRKLQKKCIFLDYYDLMEAIETRIKEIDKPRSLPLMEELPHKHVRDVPYRGGWRPPGYVQDKLERYPVLVRPRATTHWQDYAFEEARKQKRRYNK